MLAQYRPTPRGRRCIPACLVIFVVWCLLKNKSIALCPRFGVVRCSQRSTCVSHPGAHRYRRVVLRYQQQIEDISSIGNSATHIDTRPHAQQASKPRTARRLNHAFRYMYRHDDATHRLSDIRNMTSLEFLVDYAGYTYDQVHHMNLSFPPLLSLSVRRHLWPKLRFLTTTVGLNSSDGGLLEIPPQYFGARLERAIAPRHAFLMYQGLPYGRDLLRTSTTSANKTLWHDFLSASRNTKQFSALCNTWRRSLHSCHIKQIDPKQIEAFDTLFQRGLMAAARDELCQHNNTWPFDYVDVSSGDMIDLLIMHGANPMERDVRGITLLHWAAGTGNLDGVKRLLPHFKDGASTPAERDGAMPLHWAAAGAKAREFGCGGHIHVCTYLLNQMESSVDRYRVVNQLTKDGNSVLMWAAWSGTLDVVKLLIRNRADATVPNHNGCTVAHWASSGGSLKVCRYLEETVGVDFTEANHGGNTPLTHAVAFGRADVVEWLRKEIGTGSDDRVAAALAKEFVGWTDGDSNRQQVLNMFDDWFGTGGGEDELSTSGT